VIRTFCRRALPVAAGLFVACAVIQVFLAGLGVFDDPRAFITHREFGYVFGWLTLLVLVFALAGRAPRRITGLAVLLLVMFAMQSVFVALRTDLPAIAALHPLNGFAILGVGVVITREAWAARRVAIPAAMTTRDSRVAAGEAA
jgi:Na+/glutamate symporter